MEALNCQWTIFRDGPRTETTSAARRRSLADVPDYGRPVDHVRVFPLIAQNVFQEGFNAFVHRHQFDYIST
jgi:hypothetical protein